MKKTIIFGLVFLILIVSVIAIDTPTFLEGKSFNISVDKWEYNQKSGQICSNITKTKEDLNIFEKAIGKKDSISLIKTDKDKILDNEELNITIGQTKKVCKSYNYPIGYSTKFDIVSGDDVLDPVINISNPYNETCESPLWEYFGSSGSTSSLIETTLISENFNKREALNISFYYRESGGHTGYYNTYVISNGAEVLIDSFSVPFDTFAMYGGDGFVFKNTSASMMNITGYRIKSYVSYGADVSYVKNDSMNWRCSWYFNDKYSLYYGYTLNVTIQNSTSCNVSEFVHISQDNVTYYDFTNQIYQFTIPVSDFYMSINKSNCSWVYINLQAPNFITNFTLLNHSSGALYNTTTSVSIIDLNYNTSNNYSTSTGYLTNVLLYYNTSYLIITKSAYSSENAFYMDLSVNTSTNIFLLDDAETTPVLFTIQDLNSIGVENVDIRLYKYFLPLSPLPFGWYYLIGTYRTGSDGSIVIPLKTFGLYKYEIYYNGELLQTEQDTPFIALLTNSRTFTIDISQYSTTELLDFNTINPSIYYNVTTDTFIWTWNSSANIVNPVCVDICVTTLCNSSTTLTQCTSAYSGIDYYSITSSNDTIWYRASMYGYYGSQRVPLGQALGSTGSYLPAENSRSFLWIYILIALGIFFLVLRASFFFAVIFAFAFVPYIFIVLHLLIVPIAVTIWIVEIILIFTYVVWRK